MSVRSLLLCIVILVSTSSTVSQMLRGRSSGLDLQRLLLSSLIDKPDRPDLPDRRDIKDSPEVKIYTIRANNPIIIRRAPSRGLLTRGLSSSGLSSLGLSSRGLLTSGLGSGSLTPRGLSTAGLMSSDIGSQYRTLKLLGLL
ncbi:uncharacterized protein LOC117324478 [Pecten maximus]|uniref:uncharacterized protein LOC117324478 n=1 Tax=Pecten maximus TaxID=6579 RepID=UPI0014581D9C|nr:uncharacterized protein LOC117324478 [Pecten maximus]